MQAQLLEETLSTSIAPEKAEEGAPSVTETGEIPGEEKEITEAAPRGTEPSPVTEISTSTSKAPQEVSQETEQPTLPEEQSTEISSSEVSPTKETSEEQELPTKGLTIGESGETSSEEVNDSSEEAKEKPEEYPPEATTPSPTEVPAKEETTPSSEVPVSQEVSTEGIIEASTTSAAPESTSPQEQTEQPNLFAFSSLFLSAYFVFIQID